MKSFLEYYRESMIDEAGAGRKGDVYTQEWYDSLEDGSVVKKIADIYLKRGGKFPVGQTYFTKYLNGNKNNPIDYVMTTFISYMRDYNTRLKNGEVEDKKSVRYLEIDKICDILLSMSKEEMDFFAANKNDVTKFSDILARCGLSNKLKEYEEKISSGNMSYTGSGLKPNSLGGFIRYVVLSEHPEFMPAKAKPEPKDFSSGHEKWRNSAAKQNEDRLANEIDKWIRKDDERVVNQNIDAAIPDDRKKDHFYSVQSGDNSNKTDTLVVHDKPPFNDKSITPGKEDKYFYVEAKFKEGRGMNPRLHLVDDGVDENGNTKFKFVSGRLIRDKKEDYIGKLMLRIFGYIYDDLLDSLGKARTLMKEFDIKDKATFPRDFDLLSRLFDHIIEMANRKGRKEFDVNDDDDKMLKYLEDRNYPFVDKIIDAIQKDPSAYDNLKNDSEPLDKKMTMLRICGNKINLGGEIKTSRETEEGNAIINEFTQAMVKWYEQDKETAYIEFNDKKSMGVYIFSPNNDPLGLLNHYSLDDLDFSSHLSAIRSRVRNEQSKKRISFQFHADLDMESNGLSFEQIFATLKLTDKDDKKDFFKENEK